MVAKRLFDESGTDPDQPGEKRLRKTPSFATVIREAMMFQNLCSALEPLLRRVVREEIEHVVARATMRTRSAFRSSPPVHIDAVKASNYQLVFNKKLALPIFTCSKIEGEDKSPLLILLIDSNHRERRPTTPPFPIKLEIVVLDGDFLSDGREEWTSEEFETSIVRERDGKRPLLTGDVLVPLREGVAYMGELELTDNSSWIRSRTFRLGVRVTLETSQGMRIKEAITEAFSVKDHRGELYRKHHPPSLDDEVWRLEKIGKDGAFQKRLAAANINTVQEFLKLSVVDPGNLRAILGNGMSDKMWEVTIKHAQSCELGNKHYLHRGPRFAILLNPICQVKGALIDGHMFPTNAQFGRFRAYVKRLELDAYHQWDKLEVIEGLLSENHPLLQNELMSQRLCELHRENIAPPNHQPGFFEMGTVDLEPLPYNNVHTEYTSWPQSPIQLPASSFGARDLYTSHSLSDDEPNPTQRFLLDS